MRRTSRIASALVALAVFGCSGLAGCTSARNGLGISDSQCFRILPQAKAAVGKSATFEGVRRLPGSALVKAIDSSKHHSPPPDALVDVAHQSTCLVNYRGTFTVGGVQDGWAVSPAGPYRAAVVVVGLSNGTVVVTVLFRTAQHSIEFLHRVAFFT